MRPVLLLAATMLGLAPVVESSISTTHPSTTAAPKLDLRQLPRSTPPAALDAISLAQVLLTAVPQSLREIAATNLPEASRILWSDFLDGNTPSWFAGLPSDIQTYLVGEFAPSTPASVSTTGSRSATSTPATSTALTTTPATSRQSESSAVVVTSFVTVTPGSLQTSTADSGVSYNDKVIIGLSIPLALLIITVAILAFCLIRQCRRRRRAPSEIERVESRPPTPAFLSSTLAARPTPTLRGGTSSWPFPDDYDDGGSRFPDARSLAAVGAVAQPKRHSHTSPSSLAAVAEDEREFRRSDGYGYHGPLLQPRAGGSILDNKHQFVETTVPVHPLHRSRGSFGSGEDMFTIARKPVPTSSTVYYEDYDPAVPGRQAATDLSDPGYHPGHQPSQPTRSGPLGAFGSKVSRYLAPSRPAYDRYDKV